MMPSFFYISYQVNFLIVLANSQPNLAFITVPILNRDNACNVQQNGRVSELMICARGNQNNQGVCLPNRGSGLYCNNLLTGVLSFGFGCGRDNTPGVYIQVRNVCRISK